MLNQVILWSLQNRLVVLALAILLFVFGIRSAVQAPLDVFPDFAPPQVVIQTEAPGMSAEETEQLVTLPLETALNGTANLETIRSSSIVGLSVLTCVFQAGTDIFQARQLVSEKLQLAAPHLPDTAGQPQMMPISSPVGILFKISVTSGQTSPMDLRTLADWTIRPRLLAVPGIAQVATFGGEVKQYQVVADPAKLQDYGVTLTELMSGARRSNQNAGAGFFDTTQQTMVIQGDGRIHSLGDLESAVVKVSNNVPVRIRDVAQVKFAPEYKVGDSSTFGKPSASVRFDKEDRVSEGSLRPEEKFVDHAKLLSFSLSLPLPFFNRQQGNISEAISLQSQARAQREALEQRVRRDVLLAFERYDFARRAMDVLNRGVITENQESFQIVKLSYDLGELRLVDLLNQQRVLIDTQMSYLEVQRDSMLALVDLERAIGSAGLF